MVFWGLLLFGFEFCLVVGFLSRVVCVLIGVVRGFGSFFVGGSLELIDVLVLLGEWEE